MKIWSLIGFFLLSINSAFAQDKSEWSFEAHGGFPLNIPLPLTVQQTGYPAIKFNAQFNSEPFNSPIFWVGRFNKWKNSKAWEFELMHQKLFLKNKPPEIQYFNMSHGYNQLIVSRAFKFKIIKKQEFIFKGGAGIVLAHAENSVRNKELNQHQSFFNLGYYFGGPTINIALAKQLPLNNRFYLNAETKFNTSYARIPIVDGNAKVWHAAFEFIFGVGYCFIRD